MPSNEDLIRQRAYFIWHDHADHVRNWLTAEQELLDQDRPPLLLFLGAGASVGLGIPSTGSLTAQVVPSLASPSGGPGGPIGAAHLTALTNALTRTYLSPNFEHYQHGLESLAALIRSYRPSTVPGFRVVEAELTGGLHATFPRPLDELWLIAARNEFFRAIYRAMSAADQAVAATPAWTTVSSFFQRLAREFKLYVVTTNYDTIAEQALGWGPQQQGFESIPGEDAWRFIARDSPPNLMHIHGSLQFGYREGAADPNRFRFEDDHEDLYFYEQSPQAYASWFGRSGLTSMAGRDTHAGPIITGLQKPDKLLPEPYMSYYSFLQGVCRTTPRVLIAGYGFGDQHLNAVLSRLGKWHGPRRRVAVIDYCSAADWVPASAWSPQRLPFYRMVARWAAQADALDVLPRPDPWVSSGPDGGCVEVYFDGMEGSVAAHGSRMVEFLKS